MPERRPTKVFLLNPLPDFLCEQREFQAPSREPGLFIWKRFGWGAVGASALSNDGLPAVTATRPRTCLHSRFPSGHSRMHPTQTVSPSWHAGETRPCGASSPLSSLLRSMDPELNGTAYGWLFSGGRSRYSLVRLFFMLLFYFLRRDILHCGKGDFFMVFWAEAAPSGLIPYRGVGKMNLVRTGT